VAGTPVFDACRAIQHTRNEQAYEEIRTKRWDQFLIVNSDRQISAPDYELRVQPVGSPLSLSYRILYLNILLPPPLSHFSPKTSYQTNIIVRSFPLQARALCQESFKLSFPCFFPFRLLGLIPDTTSRGFLQKIKAKRSLCF
jgi:hypothetical protein